MHIVLQILLLGIMKCVYFVEHILQEMDASGFPPEQTNRDAPPPIYISNRRHTYTSDISKHPTDT